MKPKDKGSLWVQCPTCQRTFRVTHSAAQRRKTLFCTRPCYYKALYEFTVTYGKRGDDAVRRAA